MNHCRHGQCEGPHRDSQRCVQCCASCLRPRSEEHTSELQSQSNLVCRLLLEKKKCARSEEHTSELQSQSNLVCRLLLEKKKQNMMRPPTCRRQTTSCRGDSGRASKHQLPRSVATS